MKKSMTAKWILVLAIIGMLGIGAVAMADQGKGPGSGGGESWGDCPRGYGKGVEGERGPRWLQDFTDEERQQLDAEREAFFDATSDLRQSIHQKKLELRAEMAKETPNVEIATNLQTEISGLKAEMAGKRLQHQFKVKEINPELGSMMGRKGDHSGHGGYGGGRGGCSRW
jgi:zinc resistance-associated protein